MGPTWSEILPAVAKQHPPPTSRSVPLVSRKNAQGALLAQRKLINFSQDLPPCVRTHTLPPSPLLSLSLSHRHNEEILVNESMRGCQCLRSTVLIYALSSWAKNKDHTECCATESCKTEFKVTSLVLSRQSNEVQPSSQIDAGGIFWHLFLVQSSNKSSLPALLHILNRAKRAPQERLKSFWNTIRKWHLAVVPSPFNSRISMRLVLFTCFLCVCVIVANCGPGTTTEVVVSTLAGVYVCGWILSPQQCQNKMQPQNSPGVSLRLTWKSSSRTGVVWAMGIVLVE